MLEFLGGWWRRLVHSCHSYWFRRKWTQAFRQATKISSVEGLYVTVSSVEARQRVVASVERAWPRIPATIQRDLEQQWKVLQRRWDQRHVGIPLHLPVFGVFRDCFTYAADKGTFIGLAMRGSFRSGFTDSLDSLVRMFDLLFLPVWTSKLDLPDELLDVEMARVFASYYLCWKHRTPASSLLCGCHDGTDELVASWGFSIDTYNEWYEQRLSDSTQS